MEKDKMSLKDKLKRMFTTDDDDYYDSEDDYYEDELPAKVKASLKHTKPQGIDGTLVLFEPNGFDEVNLVGDRIKSNQATLVNLKNLDASEAQRSIDFLSGIIYALDGDISKIGGDVILCAPNNFGVENHMISGVHPDSVLVG